MSESSVITNQYLAIIVIGASGDLAKKKTYPSLYNLFLNNLLPTNTVIWGYGRTDMARTALHRRLLPHLLPNDNDNDNRSNRDNFLSLCYYQRGDSYTDIKAFQLLHQSLPYSNFKCNILFYLAIPPNLFYEAASTISTVFLKSSPSFTTDKSIQNAKLSSPPSSSSSSPPPWNRVILEKPFGRDLATYETLSKNLSRIFHESQMFRIDHYLGKEMVRSIPSFRFTNSWTKSIWSHEHIEHVLIVMKEDFGTEGRGGYFDHYGIVRDVMQNHLLQLLTLIAMEDVMEEEGDKHENIAIGTTKDETRKVMMGVRDAKVKVLDKIRPPSFPDDCVLGQYEGYSEDPTVTNKNTVTPTYAAVRLYVDNDRWRGVPFILVAGKALDESKVEVRLVLRDGGKRCGATTGVKPRMNQNELVIRIQPHRCIYLTTNIKGAGYDDTITENAMVLKGASNKKDDAYGKLVLDALRGRALSFVRDDELRKSWEIFTPLLQQIEDVMPYPYKIGSCGPSEAAILVPDINCKARSSYSGATTFSKL